MKQLSSPKSLTSASESGFELSLQGFSSSSALAEGALRGSDHTGLCMGTDPKVERLEVRFGNKEVLVSGFVRKTSGFLTRHHARLRSAIY